MKQQMITTKNENVLCPKGIDYRMEVLKYAIEHNHKGIYDLMHEIINDKDLLLKCAQHGEYALITKDEWCEYSEEKAKKFIEWELKHRKNINLDIFN